MATKTREIIGAIVALVLVVIMVAVGNMVFGWNLPVFTQIGNALGIGQ